MQRKSRFQTTVLIVLALLFIFASFGACKHKEMGSAFTVMNQVVRPVYFWDDDYSKKRPDKPTSHQVYDPITAKWYDAIPENKDSHMGRYTLTVEAQKTMENNLNNLTQTTTHDMNNGGGGGGGGGGH